MSPQSQHSAGAWRSGEDSGEGAEAVCGVFLFHFLVWLGDSVKWMTCVIWDTETMKGGELKCDLATSGEQGRSSQAQSDQCPGEIESKELLCLAHREGVGRATG